MTLCLSVCLSISLSLSLLLYLSVALVFHRVFDRYLIVGSIIIMYNLLASSSALPFLRVLNATRTPSLVQYPVPV